MTLLGDWLAVIAVAAPLIAKAFSDWQANAVANHNAALARVVGMASREAATIARTLSAEPTEKPATEGTLVDLAVNTIMTEMKDSTTAIGADTPKVTAIVQGEVDKIKVSG